MTLDPSTGKPVCHSVVVHGSGTQPEYLFLFSKAYTTVTSISDRLTNGGAEEASWIYEVRICLHCVFT